MTSSEPRLRAYLACSFDGFVAGPDDDLSWLTEDRGTHTAPNRPDDGLGFEAFMGQVGAMLMGRRTYDIVAAMGVWPYDDTPVLVATHRPLAPIRPTVQAVGGDIVDLVAKARATAGDKDVYLDGAALLRQALDAGLVDEMIITMVPLLLGDGVRLFDGLTARHRLTFVGQHRLAPDMIQITAEVRR